MIGSATICKRAKPLLGTWVEIRVDRAQDHSLVPEAVNQAFALCEEWMKRLSFFDSDSELSIFNRSLPAAWQEVSIELAALLDRAHEIETESQGAFNLTPSCMHMLHGPRYEIRLIENQARRLCDCPLDLGGIAKGFIVDRAFERLCEILGEPARDWTGAVNAGGDLRIAGRQEIEIRIPCQTDSPWHPERRWTVELENSAVSTSSVLGHFSVSGAPSARYTKDAFSLAAQSATAIASTCIKADADAKVGLFGKTCPSSVLRFDASGERLT